MVLKHLFCIFVFLFYSSIILTAEKKDKEKINFNHPLNYKNLKQDGEWIRPNFFGPLAPPSSDFALSTDVFYDNYPSNLLFPSFFELQKNVFKVFPSVACSDYSIDKSFEYSRYLFRLITLSYLFENLRELRKTALGLGGFAYVCPMGKKLFSDCSPKDNEMKKFLSRVEHKAEEWSFVTDKLFVGGEVQKIIGEINNKDDPFKSKRLSIFRIKEFCYKKKNCPKNIQDILKSISQICKIDTAFIQNICSEKDNLMGLSTIPLASSLILESNTISVINSVESGVGCLNRFSSELKNKEHYPSYLKGLFSLVFTQISNDKDRRYKQGLLFLPGSLKEFDDRGLHDFIFIRATPIPLAVVPTPLPLPTVIPTPPAVIVAAPVPTPIVIIPTPRPILTEFRSTQFDLAAKMRKIGDKDFLAVDMEKFKKDVGIPQSQVYEYKKIFDNYQKRESLQEMKEFDKLGSVHEPFRLIFLKYLLDNKIHQGLYNIQSVLGEKFFVINDIDQSSDIEYIQLKSGSKNSVGWEILILKYPPKEEKVKPSPLKVKSPK